MSATSGSTTTFTTTTGLYIPPEVFYYRVFTVDGITYYYSHILNNEDAVFWQCGSGMMESHLDPSMPAKAFSYYAVDGYPIAEGLAVQFDGSDTWYVYTAS